MVAIGRGIRSVKLPLSTDESSREVDAWDIRPWSYLASGRRYPCADCAAAFSTACRNPSQESGFG